MSEREILCDECGDCAVEVPHGALATDLDGVHACCQSCNTDGKIVWFDDADADGVYTRLYFRRLTETEESELAALACDEGCPYGGTGPDCTRDEVELEVDRMFQDQDAEEIARAMIDQGYVERWMSQKIGELDDEGRSLVTDYIDRYIAEHIGPDRTVTVYHSRPDSDRFVPDGPGLAKCGPKKNDLPN